MRRLSALLAAFALAACHRAPEHVSVTHAWVRLAAVPGQPSAAYFAMEDVRTDMRLVKVESALAQRAELHESMKTMAGMGEMKPLASVDLPAGGKIAFAPGGRHVMLFGLDPLVKPGTAVPLRFGFSDGSTTEAEAKTVAAGDDAPY
ncbi:hypothetical protein FHS31_002233 [Sphingomonas vulcanisoli]|uniref:Copper chaperone PCu(A)C n=1 Tax=Sphingomonas vulcanisoli TaxID=1658060 RepID=A0ABX0TT05_9SPHN|nr:copper chaperone PCu(A)C [Sphingomonas vulcanisoli]NIJ08612.1 hypothetical protein [Sphingomonas vulcanisoli]